MHIKFLGTSSMDSIPRVNCDCAQCRSKDNKDKRLRSSALIDEQILIDAGPDLERQIEKEQIDVQKIKAAFLTHRHSDADAKIDLLKEKNTEIKIFFPEEIFADTQNTIVIDDYKILAFKVPHSSSVETAGYKIGDFVYASDFEDITAGMLGFFQKANTLVLDGSIYERNFGGHLAMKDTVKILKEKVLKLNPDIEIYFTHNGHIRIPHHVLENDIQKLGGKNFHLAYDGLELNI